ncbi:MAG: peptidylprolyl isomerase [Janthinobacterium lividum]
MAACLIAAPALAQNVAIVNGTAIPVARADALATEMIRQGQQVTPDTQIALREELINRELLMQEAAREGIPNQPDVKAQIALAQQSVVIRALLANYLQAHQPSDADLHKQYDAIIQQIGGKQYHLHHILVPDEAQAKDLIAKIKAGASFEDLAKQYSKDGGSAPAGGDLSWGSLQSFVPEFSAAAAKLQKGEVTQTPVHTQFGWHIIRLDDTRDIKVPAFEDVKAQIAERAQQQQLQVLETQLRSQAKIQ